MIHWTSLAHLFPRKREQAMQRERRLMQAYQNVFRGNPSRECQELVLADLAHLSGFAMVSGPSTPDNELWFNEGKRFLFSRVRAYLNLTPEDADALDLAARREAALNEQG
jgi:hypothetical protein